MNPANVKDPQARLELNPDLARQALEVLFSPYLSRTPTGFIEVRGKREGEGMTFREFYRNPEALVKDMPRWDPALNYWFGVALRRDTKGGKKKDLLALTATFGDVDCGAVGHKKAPRYQTRAEALAAIEQFSLRATILIDSGGGYQPYWLFREAVELLDGNLSLVERINKGLALALGGDVGATDAARILRLPGTFNMKLAENPRPVEIVWCEPQRVYDLSELTKYELKPQAQGRREAPQRAARPHVKAEYGAYAQAALEQELAILRGTPEKSRNIQLNKSAFSLGQLVGAGILDRGEVEAALYDTALSIRLGDTEIKDTVRSGLEAGIKEPRALPEKEARGKATGAQRPPDQDLTKTKEKGEDREAPITTGLSLTDMGNAQRLVALHGSDLRYCYPWDKWLVWDGRRWAIDDTGEIDRRAKGVVRTIYAEAAMSPDKKQREALANHALKSESEGKRKAMIASARSEPGIPILPEDPDKNPWFFNVLNGTLDLQTGHLRPHKKGDLITKLAPVEHDPQAQCPTWWAFLERVLNNNGLMIEFLQKSVGYALTGDTREQCLFFLYGLGANGKSTLLEILQALLGEYANRTSSETFLVKKGGQIPNDVADLRGARFVAAVEVEAGRRLAEVLVKEMTGGDRIKARFLYSEYFQFTPEFKIFLAANHKPVIRGTDNAIWRRIHLLPFTVQIPKEEQDKELPAKLKAELSGILNWAIGGCLQWQHEGLNPPQAVQEATQEYREEMDPLGDFLSECCIVAPGSSIKAKDLYSSYSQWAEESGEKKPLSKTAFGLALTERGFSKERGTGGIWYRFGIKLKAGE